MAGDAFQLNWEVSERGYQLWTEAGGKLSALPEDKDAPAEDVVIAESMSAGAVSPKVKRYSPLDKTGLFRMFVDIETTPEKVLEFVNEYGLLGGNVTRTYSIRDVSGTCVKVVGERLERWISEINQMRQTIDLWDAVRKENYHKLSLRIIWNKNGVQYRASQEDLRIRNQRMNRWIANKDTNPELLRSLKPKDVMRPALVYIDRTINFHLKEKILPQLVRDPVSNPKYDKISVHFILNSLENALWLQFAQAVAVGKDHRKCCKCKTWFEVAGDASRKDKIYCSNACRTRAYRGRLKKQESPQ